MVHFLLFVEEVFACVSGGYSRIPAGCTGIIVLAGVLLVLALFLIKLLWAWAIPDLFPGGVEQGLIAESLSWYTAFKLALFVSLMGALAGVRVNRGS